VRQRLAGSGTSVAYMKLDTAAVQLVLGILPLAVSPATITAGPNTDGSHGDLMDLCQRQRRANTASAASQITMPMTVRTICGRGGSTGMRRCVAGDDTVSSNVLFPRWAQLWHPNTPIGIVIDRAEMRKLQLGSFACRMRCGASVIPARGSTRIVRRPHPALPSGES